MSLTRGVWVDPAGRLAHVQPGCLLGDVDRETQVHGLAAVLGFVSNTGAAGLTLGGGFGYLTRQFGWASDCVRSMTVATADGRLVRASEEHHADLFWGLRGGGGNFGVVTNFEYRLHPVGPEILAGAIAWPGSAAPDVLEMYRTLREHAPAELTCVAMFRKAPPAPWLPEAVHGQLIVALLLCCARPAEEAERLVRSIEAFGSPVGNIVQRRPYVTQQSLLDATQPKGRRYYWKSEYLAELSPSVLMTVADHAARMPSPLSGIILFPIDGAVQRLPEDHSAAGNRNARVVLNITGSWERPEDDAVNVEWARTAWRDLRRFSTGGTYINFLTEEEGHDRVRSAYGANYDRLIDIKTTWDPDNFFLMNKNIAPRQDRH
jgi:FAD/FMN-containing dehydrogenase